MNRSLIVTGMPRGGTTLLGSMINRLENAYCLSEPMAIEDHLQQSASADEFLRRTRFYFSEQRERIITTGRCLNRVDKDGKPVTNYFKRTEEKSVEHIFQEVEEVVCVRDENFLLAVKHNAHFLSILPLISSASDFSVLAILRHPIPTILSWRSLNLPISRGRLPSGEKFWPELSELAQSDRDLLLKQVLIYELLASRLVEFRRHIHLLCYESLVLNPEQLCLLLGQRFKDAGSFESRNKNKEYNWDEVQKIKALLKTWAPVTLRFYPDLDDLESLIALTWSGKMVNSLKRFVMRKNS